jgi:hypothetical protein
MCSKVGSLLRLIKDSYQTARKESQLLQNDLLVGTSTDVADQMLAMTTALSNYDRGGALSIQTALVSHKWRNHKEWLKGIKALVQLATKLC